MDVFEIQIESFPNQITSTSINSEDVFFDISTFGTELFTTIYTDNQYLLQNYRFPINTPVFFEYLRGYILFSGSYNWKTLNTRSFYYFIPEEGNNDNTAA